MRLWHKNLIPVLPRQQLLAQWRECCCIARNIAVNGTPNHILVNKIFDYPNCHFYSYTRLVINEMTKRGYKCDFTKFEKWTENYDLYSTMPRDLIFRKWHNDRYLNQCYFNLQEKYDCGGISESEWKKILEKIKKGGLQDTTIGV